MDRGRGRCLRLTANGIEGFDNHMCIGATNSIGQNGCGNFATERGHEG